MSLDFRQVQEQVRQLGEQASGRQELLKNLRQWARDLLKEYSDQQPALREKVRRVVASHDPYLRCAVPPDPGVRPPEPLDAAQPLPPLPTRASILAADGSQIPVDRHAEVLYSLVNVGAIHMRLQSGEPPQLTVRSQLLYDEEIYKNHRMITDAFLARLRDVQERGILAELAQSAAPPVITFTDGPVELWGADEGDGSGAPNQISQYLHTLQQLEQMGASVAGYVDKPTADLVVRLLEVAVTPENELKEIKEQFPLNGVSDYALFQSLLHPGERSVVFAFQSPQARQYKDGLALHFFYLNVGREGHPWLARVDIPAWVAGDAQRLDVLQAVLVDQCRMMGSRPYPYLLHRAHETAVVTLDDREQVTQMIALELRRRHVEVGEVSQKQGSKDLSGRTRYP